MPVVMVVGAAGKLGVAWVGASDRRDAPHPLLMLVVVGVGVAGRPGVAWVGAAGGLWVRLVGAAVGKAVGGWGGVWLGAVRGLGVDGHHGLAGNDGACNGGEGSEKGDECQLHTIVGLRVQL